MKEQTQKLESVSMNGRMAYAIMCLENYVLAKYPERDWKAVFEKLWEATGDTYWDAWSTWVNDMLPECLFEFPSYQESDFSNLDEETYDLLCALTRDLPDTWSKLLRDIFDLEEVYAYTAIPGTGKESLEIIEEMLAILENEKVDPPNPEAVSFSKFSERDGWGGDFDGKSLSRII